MTFTGERALELHFDDHLDHRVVNVSNVAPTVPNLASTFGNVSNLAPTFVNVSNFTPMRVPSDGQTMSVPAQMFMTCANGFFNVVTCATIPASSFNQQQVAQMSNFQQPMFQPMPPFSISSHSADVCN